MKVVGDAPEWAIDLFKRVCKDYNRGLPSNFIWRNRNGKSSSGTTRSMWYSSVRMGKNGKLKKYNFYGEVCVRAGTDVQDQTLVLLHEIAHHICARSKSKRGQGHTMMFWRTAFALYDKYGVDMDYAFKREKNYKAKATEAYEQHIAAQKEMA